MSERMTDLAIAMEALSREGHRAKDMAESCKWHEPMVTVTLDEDGIWSVDFYSYCLGLNDQSRHHVAGANDYDMFIDHLWSMVKAAKKENAETERHNLGQPGVAG